jgi:pilus assembly protein Flp/PilA
MKQFLSRFLKDEQGATAIEYSLIASGIAGVVFTSVNMMGIKLVDIFDSLCDLY